MLPLDFIDMMMPQLGSEIDSFCRALQQPPVVSVRLNDKKPIDDFGTDVVPWCDNAYYLSSRPQFTLDPLLHAGCYYVQDASSMFIEHVLKQYVSRSSVVLDLCAAPGGKSTLISQYLNQGGLLVSNEVVRQRVFILSENVQKWGNGNVVVTHNRPASFGERMFNAFDCVLVDAPCSGEGMFRKDERAQDEWSVRNVEMCAERQKNILMDVWDALKPGGILIYSTCTFNTQEDEQIAKFIASELGADLLHVPVEPQWGITETIGYHFYPHKVRGEGFYVAVFRKREAAYASVRFKVDQRRQTPVECRDILRTWIKNPEQWALRQEDRFSIAYPKQHSDIIEYLLSCMTCISIGFGVGEMRGRQPAPQHSLSMSKHFNSDKFEKVELDKPTALSYLRAEALHLEDKPFGYLLLTYLGQPLGFVKNVGTHCNNTYPKEWRIRNV